MSTILKILVPAVPPHNAEAYAYADALALRAAELPPNPRLLQFAAALTERYPCWSSGAYAGEAGRAACPWTETPLANCFRGDMGIIGITGLNPDVVPFVLRRAGAFALTVIDQQGGRVYRPATFCVAFKGVQKNVSIDAMVNKLMPLLKASREQVLTAIRTPDILLKCRLDYVTAKRFVATMDLIGCNCTIEKEVLVPAAGAAAAGISAAAAAAASISAAAVAAEVAALPPAAEAAAGPPAAEVVAEPPAAEVAAGPPAAEVAAESPAAEVVAGPPAAEVAAGPPAAEAVAGPPAAATAPAAQAAAAAATVPAAASVASSAATATATAIATAIATAKTTPTAEPSPRADAAAPASPSAAIPAPGPDLPIVPTTTATARLAMARFEVAEPDGRRRRGSDDAASPSWFARLFGRAGRG